MQWQNPKNKKFYGTINLVYVINKLQEKKDRGLDDLKDILFGGYITQTNMYGPCLDPELNKLF